jgi:chemotaxis protein methyltransferase CheR
VSWTNPACATIAGLVAAATGMHFPDSRRDSVEQAIGRAMKRAGAGSLECYHALLAATPAALDDLIDELTIGETYFFRDPAQFDFIRSTVLPPLRDQPGRVVRAWSAGCASGEEAYSLAIVFEQEGLRDRYDLLATDVARAALARARLGIYTRWSLRGGSAPLPYLSPRSDGYAVDDRLSSRVTFAYLNLARDCYPSPATGTWELDLILCRNVLIYLDEETVREVAGRFFRALAPGGWLITAASDPPLQDRAPFAITVSDAGVFYRRPAPPSVRGSAWDRTAREALPRKTQEQAEPARQCGPRQSPGPREEDAVRALAGQDLEQAERFCADAAARHPLSVELHYLHAVHLMALGRDDEAVRALRRVVYLDRGLAVGHFTLGAVLGRRGDRAGARRAYRNARELCAARPADEIVPLSDGERAGRLAEAASFQIALLTDEEAAP